MSQLKNKLVITSLAIALALVCAVLAQEEVIPYKAGDYIKYRVESRFSRVDGREIICVWVVNAKITDISYPFVYLTLEWRLERGDSETCGPETATSEVRCRIDITPESLEFSDYWEWPILIDPQYSQVYRIKGGVIYEEVFEYKKGVLVKRVSKIPEIFGVYEVTVTLLETSIDLDRPSILWILALLALGAGLAAVVFKLSRRAMVKSSSAL